VNKTDHVEKTRRKRRQPKARGKRAGLALSAAVQPTRFCTENFFGGPPNFFWPNFFFQIGSSRVMPVLDRPIPGDAESPDQSPELRQIRVRKRPKSTRKQHPALRRFRVERKPFVFTEGARHPGSVEARSDIGHATTGQGGPADLLRGYCRPGALAPEWREALWNRVIKGYAGLWAVCRRRHRQTGISDNRETPPSKRQFRGRHHQKKRKKRIFKM
jgi:hypothetical protein